MTSRPTWEDIFAVMAQVSVGEVDCRVQLPRRLPADHLPARFAVALNILLDDLAMRTAETERLAEELREAQLREADDRTRSIVEAALEAYVAMDATGRIIDWNGQAEATFGWTRAEVLGRTVADTIIPAEFRGAHDAGLRRFLATGEGPVLKRRVELTALHRDGRVIPVEIVIWPSGTGDRVTFNAFVHDITERHQRQAELTAAHARALEASRLKSEFLANMSHEIRTPMNGVIGMTELLLDTPLSAEQLEYAQSIDRSAESLLAIINDILDLSKIEAGKLELEAVDFDLRAAVEDAAHLLAARAADKGLELAVTFGPRLPGAVRGDPLRLRQVLVNLLGNAVKFTPAGEVVLQVARARAKDGRLRVRFEVRDTGIGIPPAYQERLFDTFSQADTSTTRHFGGTGLGLAISRQLTALMGGEIGCESRPGAGSTFWFTCAYEPAAQPLAPAGPVAAAGLRGLRVLLVDDNQTNRAVLRQVMKVWGIRPSSASGGRQALARLRRATAAGQPFDLAILDQHMPGMSGIELARAIRAEPAIAGMRLVMLTSAAGRGDSDRARELGIDVFLTKPVRLGALRDCLAGLGLPAAVRPAGRGGRPAATAGSGARLLVVDDNEVNRRLAVLMLEKMGHRVDVAGDGAQAVAAVGETDYDAVLMDCQMPGMDGFEATRQIRRQERSGRRTPIIAMTAGAMARDEERCFEAGMDAHLSKPVKSPALARVLETWLHTGPGSRPEPARPAGTAVLDAATMENLCAFGEARFAQLIEAYQGQAESLVADVAAAAQSADVEALVAHAHNLKGSSANFGASALAGRCGELEAAARERDWARIEALVGRLSGDLGRTVAAQNRWLGPEAGGDLTGVARELDSASAPTSGRSTRRS